MNATTDYPAEQEVDVALRDGSTVHIRPVRADDRARVLSFLKAMSAESLYFRVFGTANVESLTDWSMNVDYADRYGVVATTGADEDVVAHAGYVRTNEHSAEVAFEVADALHGYGIATIMLAHLAGVAARNGIAKFRAVVMADNYKMAEVFRDSGFPTSLNFSKGVSTITMPTELGEPTLQAFDDRRQTAAVGAMRSILAPASVAVIGASRRPGSVGHALLNNLVTAGFGGQIYPVNPHERELHGLRVYASLADIGDSVELAVIAVPAKGVLEVARECAAIGVRALLVVSAGFAEVGGEGRTRQSELLTICRQAGMRLIGPNCIGVINTAPEVRLNATFASGEPPAGRIGFVSQSGGVGIVLMQASDERRIGVSSFVSIGNKLDISGNDLLEYWERDPSTDVILMYLESFGNPRRFARIARRVSATKPILAVKSGRSPAGARATSSHTGALISASDVTVDALFRQAGVIRADTLGELLDTATLLNSQPAPAGNRVAIVTNGGGPGILCADACYADGLAVPELSTALQARLRKFLSPDASAANPVDMIASASAADYRKALELLAKSGECDAIVTIFVPALQTTAQQVADEVDDFAEHNPAITVAAAYMDQAAPLPAKGTHAAARFDLPENAIRALAAAAGWSAWRQRPSGVIPPLDDCRGEDAGAIIAAALAAGQDWLPPADVSRLLDCYGLPMIPTSTAGTREQAVAAADTLGYPVALKATASGLLHKSDAGGVRLNLADPAAVAAAADEMKSGG